MLTSVPKIFVTPIEFQNLNKSVQYLFIPIMGMNFFIATVSRPALGLRQDLIQ
jgi:hypothetical protein